MHSFLRRASSSTVSPPQVFARDPEADISVVGRDAASDDGTTSSRRERDSPPVPLHWKNPTNSVANALFIALCFISIGQGDLEELWSNCHDKKDGQRWKKDAIDRITSCTVMAGLILASTAAFATTTPPIPSIMDYNLVAPYILLLTSIGTTFGALIVGSAVIYVLYGIKPWTLPYLLMTTRSEVYCCLILLGFPFLAVGIATIFAVFGLVLAIFLSGHILTVVISASTMCLPISMIPVVLWTQRNQMEKRQRANLALSRLTSTQNEGAGASRTRFSEEKGQQVVVNEAVGVWG